MIVQLILRDGAIVKNSQFEGFFFTETEIRMFDTMADYMRKYIYNTLHKVQKTVINFRGSQNEVLQSWSMRNVKCYKYIFNNFEVANIFTYKLMVHNYSI